MLSIVIPARNESDNLKDILNYFSNVSLKEDFEVLLINDFSEDNTLVNAKNLFQQNKRFKIYDNKKRFRGAINLGIDKSDGDKIAIMMADLSDDIKDLIKYNELIDKKNVDAILGSRFLKGSIVKDYPIRKLILNRIFNFFVGLFFGINIMTIQMHLKFTKKMH